MYTKDKNGNIQTFGDDDGKQIDCPIVVLVDENSACLLYTSICNKFVITVTNSYNGG